MRWILCLASMLAISAHAGSLYLCKAYGGGTFWAGSHCNQHNALIERIVSVPDGLPFDQQVQMGEQERARQSGGAAQTMVVNPSSQNQHAELQAECKTLDAQIANYDSMARQPQSAQTQDWIAERRKKARDRQFAIRCR